MGWSRSSIVALLVGLSSGPAAAGPRDFEAEIALVLPGLGGRVVAQGQGVAQLGGVTQLETLSLDGFVAGSTIVPVTDPLVSNGGLVAVRLDASLRTGDLRIDPFAPPWSEPALADGALALRGEIRLCLVLLDCSTGIALPLSAGPGTRGLGVGGIVTVGGSGTVRLSLYGAPFTLNTTSVMGSTAGGSAFTLLSHGSLHGPLSFTSTAGLTISGIGGRLGLVTPMRVVSAPVIPGENDLPAFASVEIQLLPEPATLAPLLIGAGALALAGRRRRARTPEVPRSESACDA
jgi:hypothetical protein